MSRSLGMTEELDACLFDEISLSLDVNKAGTSFDSADSASYTEGQSRFSHAPAAMPRRMCVDAQHYEYATRETKRSIEASTKNNVSEDASKEAKSLMCYSCL